MPSKKDYDLVSDDGYDSRIPLHNEDAFQHGIHFQAKYIGTLDVPRPSSRVEIVAAMRRIRYEFKAKAIKKRKVDLTVSVEGVRVAINKKKKRIPQWYDEGKLVIVHHPIYRIFYVSHDSQDLKIWSYIARDGQTNVFKCNVFKSYKKEQAMRIVRTIGQAFEVCHKLSVAQTLSVPDDSMPADSGSRHSIETDKRSQNSGRDDSSPNKKGMEACSVTSRSRATPPSELVLPSQDVYQLATPSPQLGGTTITSPLPSAALMEEEFVDPEQPITSRHQMLLLRQQVEHHNQQTQVAVAQVQLLKEQLAAETAARIESQARTHQLLLQNRDLLDHMNHLLGRLQKMELRASTGRLDKPSQAMITQKGSGVPDATTPQCGPVFTPRSLAIQDSDNASLLSPDMGMLDQSPLDTDSPDSGHREMSSDNLALSLRQPNFPFWTVAQDERLKYSFGFGSPVKIQQTSYEMTAVVNSNPFANSRDDICEDESATGYRNLERKHICDDTDDVKPETPPRLRPPPGFRNYGSLRNSQISEDSSASSNSDTDSVKDGIVNFTDSDYYSHTGSSSLTNPVYQSGTNFQENREGKQSGLVYKPMLEYHFNNYAADQTLMHKYLEASRRRDSFSDEENTESYEDSLAQPPSPPPPPSRHEHELDD